MPRLPRKIAKDLIQFVSKVELKAHFWDPNSTSAFELYRQMSSPKLAKVNTSFECKMDFLPTVSTPTLSVTYADGTKWSTETTGITAQDLRYQLYQKASDVEDNIEFSGPGVEVSVEPEWMKRMKASASK